MQVEEIDLLGYWRLMILALRDADGMTWATHVSFWNSFTIEQQESLKDLMDECGVSMSTHMPTGFSVLGTNLPQLCHGVAPCLN